MSQKAGNNDSYYVFLEEIRFPLILEILGFVKNQSSRKKKEEKEKIPVEFQILSLKD